MYCWLKENNFFINKYGPSGLTRLRARYLIMDMY